MPFFQKEDVRQLARRYGWQEVHHHVSTHMFCFLRGAERVVVFYSTGTVGTCTNWARLGKALLFQRNSTTLQELDEIFCNLPEPSGECCFRIYSENQPEPSLGEREWWGIASKDLFDNQFIPDETVLLALGHSYFVVKSDGSPHWGSSAPYALTHRLKARHPHLPSVSVVAFGPGKDTYFVQFVDGQQHWGKIPHKLAETLQEYSRSSHKVKTLAMGPDDSWFVGWEDGCSDWNGIPRHLENLLSSNHTALTGVDEVTLGPAGEWFVRFMDRSWSCGGESDDCRKRVHNIRQHGDEIVRIAFGINAMWLVTCESATF